MELGTYCTRTISGIKLTVSASHFPFDQRILIGFETGRPRDRVWSKTLSYWLSTVQVDNRGQTIFVHFVVCQLGPIVLWTILSKQICMNPKNGNKYIKRSVTKPRFQFSLWKAWDTQQLLLVKCIQSTGKNILSIHWRTLIWADGKAKNPVELTTNRTS